MLKKEESVVNYYVLTTRLKDVIRKGWINACVKRERLESVAEHVYQAQNLAIAMYYAYKPDIDLMRVLFMIAVHEIDEIILGDIAMSDPNYESLRLTSHEAVCKILSVLIDSDEIRDLIFEFDACETKDAKFAYLCDKLECDLYAKLLSDEGCFDIEALMQKDNAFQKKIVTGKEKLADLFLPADEHIYQSDENFKAVFEYARDNDIAKYRYMK